MFCFKIEAAFKSFPITSSSHLCSKQMTGAGAREEDLVLVERNSNPGQNCRENCQMHVFQDMHFK